MQKNPISLLASVLEIKDALDQEEYITYLPIPIDGSNNGWQHLCAMSKDKEAGELVGIVPQDIQKIFMYNVLRFNQESYLIGLKKDK